MPNFSSVFKSEVARLARKEVREVAGATMKASAQYRRELAALKREMTALQKKVAFLEKREAGRLQATTEEPVEAAAAGIRFSGRKVKSHRKRLGLSAKDYALLVGVSPLTIYNWESGKSKPQAEKLASWAAMRDIGVREAERRLEVLGAR